VGWGGPRCLDVGEVEFNVVNAGWRMSNISAVADEAAHSSPRKLFVRCNGLAIVVLWRMGGVDRDCGRGHPFFPAMAGCGMALNHVLPYGMGGLLQCVADEATHLYPHFLYLRGDKGDRSGPPAVAEDVDFRGVLSLHRECDGYYSVVAIRADTT